MDVTHVSEYVMNTLCRICAEKSSKLIPIFKDNLLSQKIDKCLPIKVARSDHLPLNVCESCFVRIDESYLFYEMVCQSDERLKKLWKILIKETLIRCPDIVPPENNKFKNELFNTQSDISCDNQQSKKLEAKQDNNLIKDNLSNFITNASEVTYSGLEFTDSNEEKIDEVMVLEKAVDLDSAKHIIEKTSVKGSIKENKSEEIQQITNSGQMEKVRDNSKHKNQTYQCQFCSRQLKTLASLSVHESTHSHQKPFLCDTCGKSFKHVNNLRCHARTHMEVKKKHICKICSKGFITNFFLQEHMNSHTGKTPYKCEVCGKAFREMVHLRQHKWTHSKEKFSCPICGNKFNRKGNMNEHVKKYHQNDFVEKLEILTDQKANVIFSCSVCNADFSSQVLLKNHLKLHPENKKFSCLICGKKFRHSGSLTYHRRVAHTGEKPFQCSYCDQRFSLRSVQQIHERKIHTFEQPFKCSFCSRLFTNSSSLKNHLYVHSKNKMFECEECGKKFSRSSNLFVHKKLHTGDRHFTCDQCGKSYIQKYDMLKHKKIHDPKSKPFFCKYCGNYFSHKKDSTKHVTCQYDFLRKNNSDCCSAEKILDSVSGPFHREAKDFFQHEDLILGSVEEISSQKS